MPRRLTSNRDDGLALQADINVTSLVDVAFTLLVIFIITAPILQGGIEVDVPQADVAPLQPSEDPIFVSIDANNRIFIEDAEVESIETFRDGFADQANSSGWEVVFLRVDRGATMETVLPIMGAISAAEGVSVSFVGEFWDEAR